MPPQNSRHWLREKQTRTNRTISSPSHPVRCIPDTLQLVNALDTPSDSVEVRLEPNSPGQWLIPRDATSRPDRFRGLVEAEMLSLALANSPVLRKYDLRILENPAGAITVYDPAITASDPFFGAQAALAEFDGVLTASVNTQNDDRVFNNEIEGGAAQQLVQDLVSLDAGWPNRTQTLAATPAMGAATNVFWIKET